MTESKKISEICDISKGKKVKITKNPSENSIPYLLIDTLRGKSAEFFTNDKKYLEAIESDILIVMDGANSGLVGTGVKGAVGSTIARIRTKENINSDYLTYFLNYNFSNLNRNTKGSAIPHVKGKYLVNLEIRLPDLEEQSLIVNEIEKELTRLADAVDSLNNLKEKLKVYRQSVLKAAFEGKLTKINDLVNTTLGKEFSIIMGQSPKSEFYNLEGNDLPFFQGKKEFTSLYPKPEVWCSKSNKIAEKDDVLVSIRAPIGPVNLAPSKCGIGRGLASIKPNEKTNPKLIFYLIKLNEQKLDSLGTGTTFKAITKPKFLSFSITLPTKKEDRDSILQEIESRFSVIDKIEAIVDGALLKTEQLKMSILKSAFEGKLVKGVKV